jgi:hypothetical protein
MFVGQTTGWYREHTDIRVNGMQAGSQALDLFVIRSEGCQANH